MCRVFYVLEYVTVEIVFYCTIGVSTNRIVTRFEITLNQIGLESPTVVK